MSAIGLRESCSARIGKQWRGRVSEGRRCREHGDDDADSVRRSRVLKSIDNTFSLRFTKASLLRVLRDTGFTSVVECHIPAESRSRQ